MELIFTYDCVASSPEQAKEKFCQAFPELEIDNPYAYGFTVFDIDSPKQTSAHLRATWQEGRKYESGGYRYH